MSVTRGNRGSLELSSVVVSLSALLKSRVLAVRQLPRQLHGLSIPKKLKQNFHRILRLPRAHFFEGLSTSFSDYFYAVSCFPRIYVRHSVYYISHLKKRRPWRDGSLRVFRRPGRYLNSLRVSDYKDASRHQAVSRSQLCFCNALEQL